MKNTNQKTHHNSFNKVTFITLCVFVLALFSVNDLFTQTSCTGATSLAANPAGACSNIQAITTISVANIPPLASAPCTIRMNGIARERWIQFIPTATTATITGTSAAPAAANRQLALIVYSGTCGSLTQIGCANNIPITDVTTIQTETVALTGLTPGVPIYVRVINEGDNAGTSIANYNANVCITSTPDNDEPSGAIPLAVSGTSLCSMSLYNNFFATNTNCSPSIPNPSCSSYIPGTSQDVWYSVAVVAPGNLNINNALQPFGLALYSGTNSPGCGSMTEVTCAETGGPANPANFAGISLSGLTPGIYYLRAWRKAGGTSTFSLCATSVPITPPANDNPCGAQLATASTNSTCVTSYSTTILGATPSATLNAPTTSCSGLSAGADNDDVWSAFTATSTTHQIAISSFTPVSVPANDFYFAVYAASGPTTCPTVSGSELLCSPTNTATVSGLTVGNRYLIRFFHETSVAGYSTGITYCITTPTVANNDECTGAVQVTPDAGSACTNTVSGTVFGATGSFQNNGCAVGDDNDDVWFSFTATSTSHSISINTGSAADFYHSVYAGVCGNIGPAIICGDPNSSILYGLTVGNNYFVRIYSSGAAALTATTGTFVLCINTPTNSATCFTPAGDNFCPNPTSLSQSAFTFTGTVGAPPSAGGIYTSDVPGNLGTVFGGSIESNSWYSFIAVSTTHTFNIVPSPACAIQARVLSVTMSGSCCVTFTSMSNFYSSTTSGTVTATGLTIGNTYYLMVDGNSNANCNYSIPTWVLTSILPIEFVSFIGNPEGKMNVLEWVTAFEDSKSKFTLQHSRDGVSFENVITLNGKATSGNGAKYLAYDENPFEDVTYYRLKYTDNSALEKYSNIISINLKNKYDFIVNLHPNPTTNDLLFDYYSKAKSMLTIELMDHSGKTILKENQLIEEGQNSIVLPLSGFERGVYILKVVSEKSGTTSHQKVIKN